MASELRDMSWQPQRNWLERTLQEAVAQNYSWTVVVGHHPVISSHQVS